MIAPVRMVVSRPMILPLPNCCTRSIQEVSSAFVAQVRNIRPGYTVIHPNRDKAACKLTRILIVAILLGSVALMLILTIGGWSKLQGLKPINFVWCLVYLIMAYYVLRWARDLGDIRMAIDRVLHFGRIDVLSA